MRHLTLPTLLAAIAIVAVTTTSVQALPPFKKAFDDKYVAKSKDDAFKESFKKESCNTCHVKGKKKNVQNRYGHELHETLEDLLKEAKIDKSPKDLAKDEEGKKQLLEALDKALDAVAKKKAGNGTTYGDIIKEGKLPSYGDIE